MLLESYLVVYLVKVNNTNNTKSKERENSSSFLELRYASFFVLGRWSSWFWGLRALTMSYTIGPSVSQACFSLLRLSYATGFPDSPLADHRLASITILSYFYN